MITSTGYLGNEAFILKSQMLKRLIIFLIGAKTLPLQYSIHFEQNLSTYHNPAVIILPRKHNI